ncbi:DUF6318 family protein [Nocardioides psychrotolerans]|uniref:DUF6318 family protein n=1 Tax=Nocardioides psychrotolerans TaxID=1005945 RepID=UPI003137F1E3
MSRIVRAGVAVVLGALLVGCSDDPRPRMAPPSASPTVVESPTNTPTIEESAPPLPSAATARDASGAKAFVTHFWDVANYAQATGDTKSLAALGAETCEGCHGAVDFLNDLYRAGGSIEGGEYTIGPITADRLAVEGQDVTVFRCMFETSNTKQVIRQPGRDDRVLPASTVAATFTLSYQADRWQVDVWDVTAS